MTPTDQHVTMQDRSEGDINLGDARAAWQRDYIDAETRALLEEDSRWFLHQALSTPCLNVVERSEGIYLIDSAGRRIMDFHGNTVHQVGYGHPRVVEAVTRQLATLPFSPRRYTNRAAIDLARRLAELAPGRGAVCARRHRGRWHGVEAGTICHRTTQDAVDVGRVPRRVARCDFRGW
jgi:4-aminobutyrate aminotransferase